MATGPNGAEAAGAETANPHRRPDALTPFADSSPGKGVGDKVGTDYRRSWREVATAVDAGGRRAPGGSATAWPLT